MFLSDMRESYEEEIPLEEEDTEAFSQMLHYLYNDQFMLSPKTVVSILSLANQYGKKKKRAQSLTNELPSDVMRLKQFCERYLADQIDEENVFDLIEVAEQYQGEHNTTYILYLTDNTKLYS